ncbi:MAG: type VI secretion system contractile sheath large subunit [Polyangiaceae bacterium]|nr:type VI secretion system contractile sheath large subunit [Polyangiaceae bacterium]MCW5789256.1 type VI secretion system contractile sheath large subunit [Polyangiaceae bacterium]
MTGERQGGIAGFGVGFGSGAGAQGHRDGGAPEEASPRGPLRVVVVSQVTAQSEVSTGPEPLVAVRRLSRAEFDRVFTELAPSLAFELETQVVDKPLRVDLRFERLKALKPQSLVEQVPALRALVDAKRIIQHLIEGRVGQGAARDQLARVLPAGRFNDDLCRELAGADAAPHAAASAPSSATSAPGAPPAAPPAGGGLDALLAQVDIAPSAEPGGTGVTQQAPTASNASASALVSAVARAAVGKKSGSGGSTAERALTKIEGHFQALLGAILRHPEVQRLEATWRGLWLLLERANLGAGVELDLLPAGDGTEGISQALTRLAAREGIHEAERAPVDLIVVDREVSASQHDLKALEAWATLAELMRAPIVTAGSHELVGVDQLRELSFSERRHAGSTDPRAVAARAVASRDAARWVCLTLNRALVRSAYTEETARTKDIRFTQDPALPGAHVFIRGYWVVAALVMESFVRTGLGTDITGQGGVLANLPVHEVEDRGERAAIPVEVFISSESQSELARTGVAALGCARNRDLVVLSHAPVFYREPSQTGGDARPAELSLADQLFVGRFSHAVEMVAAAIPSHTPARAAGEVAQIALLDFFRNPPPVGPEVEATVENGNLIVTVRPRRFAGIGLGEVTLAAPLGR